MLHKDAADLVLAHVSWVLAGYQQIFWCLNSWSLFIYRQKTAWKDSTRNIFEVITSTLDSCESLTCSRMPVCPHVNTHARALTSKLGFIHGIVWVWSVGHVNTRGQWMREMRTDESLCSSWLSWPHLNFKFLFLNYLFAEILIALLRGINSLAHLVQTALKTSDRFPNQENP